MGIESKLSKREEAALRIAESLIAVVKPGNDSREKVDRNWIITRSVQWADLLLSQVNQKDKESDQ